MSFQLERHKLCKRSRQPRLDMDRKRLGMLASSQSVAFVTFLEYRLRVMMSDINPFVLEKIPQTDTCVSALQLARDALPIPILNHSLRVYLLARYIAEKEDSPFKSEDQSPLLFVAAIHHDIGASHLYNGEQRFEISPTPELVCQVLSP